MVLLPDFYNNDPLLIEPHKGVYACYNDKNNIEVFKLPHQLKSTIHPPKGYYSEKAIIRNNRIVVLYATAKGNKKRIVYGKYS